MKFYPVLEEDFKAFHKEIFFEQLFNLYYGKFFVERYNILKLWGLAFQIEFGDFEEKPGFIERQLILYFNDFYNKYYKNEKFINDITEYYQGLSGKSQEEALE